MNTETSFEKILSVDIGGSHVKAAVLDDSGKILQDYEKVVTSNPATPRSLIKNIMQLAGHFPAFDKVSVGFPGYVRNGIVFTAPNLNKDWHPVNFSDLVQNALGKPARVTNDADMQGLGVISGKGLEMVITLGTGFGTALLLDGRLLPHLELAHHPIKGKKDYDQYIGEKALERIGEERWNKRMQKVLGILKTVFNYDHLYIGGGNARLLTIELDKNIKIISNEDGIHGGARLWK